MGKYLMKTFDEYLDTISVELELKKLPREIYETVFPVILNLQERIEELEVRIELLEENKDS